MTGHVHCDVWSMCVKKKAKDRDCAVEEWQATQKHGQCEEEEQGTGSLGCLARARSLVVSPFHGGTERGRGRE